MGVGEHLYVSTARFPWMACIDSSTSVKTSASVITPKPTNQSLLLLLRPLQKRLC